MQNGRFMGGRSPDKKSYLAPFSRYLHIYAPIRRYIHDLMHILNIYTSGGPRTFSWTYFDAEWSIYGGSFPGQKGKLDQKTKEICLEHPSPFFDTWRYGKCTLRQSKSKREGERKRTRREIDDITMYLVAQIMGAFPVAPSIEKRARVFQTNFFCFLFKVRGARKRKDNNITRSLRFSSFHFFLSQTPIRAIPLTKSRKYPYSSTYDLSVTSEHTPRQRTSSSSTRTLACAKPFSAAAAVGLHLNEGKTKFMTTGYEEPFLVTASDPLKCVKSDFLKLSPPWVAHDFLFAHRNLVLALTPLFLGQFGQTKVLRTPKIMLFPVISGFLPISESKWELSRANTTRHDKRGGSVAEVRLYKCAQQKRHLVVLMSVIKSSSLTGQFKVRGARKRKDNNITRSLRFSSFHFFLSQTPIRAIPLTKSRKYPYSSTYDLSVTSEHTPRQRTSSSSTRTLACAKPFSAAAAVGLHLNEGKTKFMTTGYEEPFLVTASDPLKCVKSDFLKLSPPWVAHDFLFAHRNLVLALTPLFLGQFGQTKVLRTPKIMLFPVISGFLPISESKWELSRANTTRHDKRG
eukprot:sb/3463430/